MELFRERLDNILNRRHELYLLASKIDWASLEQEFGKLYHARTGRPGIPIRLLAGLTYLSHAFKLSDQATVDRWVENPYWQYFCGETYFQHKLPIDPSSLSRWRKRIGEAGCEKLLAITIEVGLSTGSVKESSFERVSVDTTVQPMDIRFPTDGRLLDRSRQRLVNLAHKFNIPLRQSYARLGPRALKKSSSYARANQFKRARKATKVLKTYLGRVYRDVLRKILHDPDVHAEFHEELELVERLLDQQRTDKNKLYSLHASEVECIAKGKAHRKYEFGVKVSVAATNRENFIVGMQALPGNPYDGHTLGGALDQILRLTGLRPQRC